MTELENVARRLLTLERQYRRLQRTAVFGAALFGAVLIMGQTDPRTRPPIIQPRLESPTQAPAPRRPEVVEEKIVARQFMLVDAQGKERASLVADGAGSAFFILFDQNQKSRAEISVSPYGPSINFYDPTGKARTVIGSTSLVSSHVVNAGIVERNPPSSIVLFDKEGKLLWRTP